MLTAYSIAAHVLCICKQNTQTISMTTNSEIMLYVIYQRIFEYFRHQIPFQILIVLTLRYYYDLYIGIQTFFFPSFTNFYINFTNTFYIEILLFRPNNYVLFLFFKILSINVLTSATSTNILYTVCLKLQIERISLLQRYCYSTKK